LAGVIFFNSTSLTEGVIFLVLVTVTAGFAATLGADFETVFDAGTAGAFLTGGAAFLAVGSTFFATGVWAFALGNTLVATLATTLTLVTTLVATLAATLATALTFATGLAATFLATGLAGVLLTLAGGAFATALVLFEAFAEMAFLATGTGFFDF